MALSVRNKLFGAFGVVVLALIVTGVFAIVQLRSVGDKATLIDDVGREGVGNVGTLRRDLLLMREQILMYVMAPKEGRQDILGRMKELEGDIAADLQTLREQKGLTETQRQALGETEQKIQEWYAARDKGPIAKTDAGDFAGAADAALYGVGGEAFRAAFDAISRFADETDKAADAAHEEAQATITRATMLTIGLVALAAVLAAGLAFWIAQGIATGVRQMLKAAEGIAEGEVQQHVEVKSRDEIGEMAGAFQRMLTYLKHMASAADSIATGDLSVEVTPVSERDALGNAFARMTGYLKDTAAAAESIAAGDLTVDVHARSEKDVLGNAFARMITNLRQLLTRANETAESLAAAKDQLSQSADQAAQATQEVARTITQVAQGTSQQATSAQEVNQGMEQLTQAIEQIVRGAQAQAQSIEEASALVSRVASAADQMAGSAQNATAGARQAAETAQNGAAMVQNAIDGMARIKSTVEVASAEITRLGERSAEIGKIVSVIDDIAAQTNLLALNAAIEAARAGEQGRGFAVVADEVRQLAERVATATKEIADLIEGVRTGVGSSVKAMSEGATEMEAGSRVAAEAGLALQQILAAVDQVNAQIEQIAAGSQELKASSDEMVNVITSIRAVVDQNTAATEEMQATAAMVSDSISAIAGVAEENSAATEQVSAAAEEMTAQVEEVTAAAHSVGAMADDLRIQVAAFKLSNDGTRPATVSTMSAGAQTEGNAPARRAA